MDDGMNQIKKKGILANLYCKHIEINISIVAYTLRIKESKHIYVYIDGWIYYGSKKSSKKKKEESYHQAYNSGIVNKSTNGINAV